MNTRVMLMVMLAVLMAAPSIPAAALSAQGRVVDMKDNPVPGIKIYALLAYYSSGFQEKVSLKAVTTADDQGRWSFNSLAKPTDDHKYWAYYFIAFKPGERLGWTTGAGELVSVPNAPAAPGDGYSIPAAPLGTFEGQVTDRDGNPIAGVVAKTAVILEMDEKCDPGG